MRIVFGYLGSYLFVIGLIVAISTIKKFSKIHSNEAFRKSVHILTAFTWIPMYEYLFGTWHFVIVPLSFVIITGLSARYNIIAIVERDNAPGSNLGIVHYSISMTILCIVATSFQVYLIPCGIGIFALSFGDGTATVFGQAFRKNNLHITKTKTLVGSIACFIFTIAGTLVFRIFTPFQITVVPLLIIGTTSAMMEIVGGRYDNYSVPIGTTIAAMLMRVSEV